MLFTIGARDWPVALPEVEGVVPRPGISDVPASYTGQILHLISRPRCTLGAHRILKSGYSSGHGTMPTRKQQEQCG